MQFWECVSNKAGYKSGVSIFILLFTPNLWGGDFPVLDFFLWVFKTSTSSFRGERQVIMGPVSHFSPLKQCQLTGFSVRLAITRISGSPCPNKWKLLKNLLDQLPSRKSLSFLARQIFITVHQFQTRLTWGHWAVLQCQENDELNWLKEKIASFLLQERALV